ncbi:MAG: tRNA (adenosine(37)-N6)-threonylcarbamoyltransferase complex transferase subunit TsaD [Bacteroidetes bacterium]|nr:tRNA (adenosine(37)-N6)-threonylcarbamoyltransferase complex transferase subunit TsaD [Bacteroidota bacterium]
MSTDKIILGIETSCDETAAAVTINGVLRSAITSTQQIHSMYGGVVPELASRVHQQNIVPVADEALKLAKIGLRDLDAVAVTIGPGLMGSLLVGVSFAKGFGLAINKPVIPVNHMQAHIYSLFIRKKDEETKTVPSFPFLCMNISGGHTQIVKVNSFSDMELLGQTLDDAAGEAFDKAAKILGLPYPGGPAIDRLAAAGNPGIFTFPKPVIPDYDFSFSGLKTAVLYFIRDRTLADPDFITNNINDICASVQHVIVGILLNKLSKAISDTKISTVGIAGGVAANSYFRKMTAQLAEKNHIRLFYPDLEFCTDNAAMVATAGYHLLPDEINLNNNITAKSRMHIAER